MIVCDEKKRTGGKLVKVCVKIFENLVKGVMISGDFFVEPEEGFEELLQELTKIEVEREEATTVVSELLKKKRLDFSGITVEDIVEVLSRILLKTRKVPPSTSFYEIM
ncbi:MAG: lipoate protein ligase C-terminal domain-containing protein [Sulfolobales archaeon]